MQQGFPQKAPVLETFELKAETNYEIADCLYHDGIKNYRHKELHKLALEELRRADRCYSLALEGNFTFKTNDFKNWIDCLMKLCIIFGSAQEYTLVGEYALKCANLIEKDQRFLQQAKDDDCYRVLCCAKELLLSSPLSTEKPFEILEYILDILNIKTNLLKTKTPEDEDDIVNRLNLLTPEMPIYLLEKLEACNVLLLKNETENARIICNKTIQDMEVFLTSFESRKDKLLESSGNVALIEDAMRKLYLLGVILNPEYNESDSQESKDQAAKLKHKESSYRSFLSPLQADEHLKAGKTPEQIKIAETKKIENLLSAIGGLNFSMDSVDQEIKALKALDAKIRNLKSEMKDQETKLPGLPEKTVTKKTDQYCLDKIFSDLEAIYKEADDLRISNNNLIEANKNFFQPGKTNQSKRSPAKLALEQHLNAHRNLNARKMKLIGKLKNFQKELAAIENHILEMQKQKIIDSITHLDFTGVANQSTFLIKTLTEKREELQMMLREGKAGAARLSAKQVLTKEQLEFQDLVTKIDVEMKEAAMPDVAINSRELEYLKQKAATLDKAFNTQRNAVKQLNKLSKKLDKLLVRTKNSSVELEFQVHDNRLSCLKPPAKICRIALQLKDLKDFSFWPFLPSQTQLQDKKSEEPKPAQAATTVPTLK